MSEVSLYRLMMNRDVILTDLEPDQVLDYLYQEDVIDGDEYEEIRDKEPRKKQAELLLSYIEKDSSAIEKLIFALEKSSQPHLARILLQPLVNEVTLSRGISKRLQTVQDDRYPMTHVPCGYAVIINNMNFDEKTKMEVREGSELDVVRMEKLFTYLQFKVDIYRNKAALEIQHIVREYQVMVDHTNFDCFVLFIMSHGYSQGVYGTDGKKVPLDKIRERFKADECYSLANKPKIIFVQACRGEKPDQGYVVTDSPAMPGTTSVQEHTSNLASHTPSVLDATLIKPPTEDDIVDIDLEYIPQDSDMFIAYASTVDHAALRHTVTGGWFVTQLYEVMRRWAKTEDLQSMMLRVTNEVSQKRSATKMQCPETGSNLRKKVFFKPKEFFSWEN